MKTNRKVRRLILIDVDGTLYDNFRLDDQNIISILFKNNILVKVLDKFLWLINSFDFFSNSMFLLKFRIFIYSILSLKSYNAMIKDYKFYYQKFLTFHLKEKENILKRLKINYTVIFVTNNVYSLKPLYLNYHVIYSPNMFNRAEQIKELNDIYNIDVMIGNNYMDDMLSAKKNNIAIIYIGNSVFKSRYNIDFEVANFDDAVKVLEKLNDI